MCPFTHRSRGQNTQVLRPSYGHPVPHTPLSPTEQAVLRALLSADGRVVSRATIARDCGLGHLSARRADSVVAALRQRLGSDALATVRQRGWMLTAEGVVSARLMLADSL